MRARAVQSDSSVGHRFNLSEAKFYRDRCTWLQLCPPAEWKKVEQPEKRREGEKERERKREREGEEGGRERERQGGGGSRGWTVNFIHTPS